MPIAVSDKHKIINFFESKKGESGSLLANHSNVKDYETRAYEVESVDINELKKRIQKREIDYLKLDIEGEEYSLIKHISVQDLSSIDQIFIEFHHHCTQYSLQDTKKAVKIIEKKGFQSYTLDGNNYLFYKKNLKKK